MASMLRWRIFALIVDKVTDAAEQTALATSRNFGKNLKMVGGLGMQASEMEAASLKLMR